ncbi:hemerythrin domain-containing protein [Chitinispirillales bacterium ANBcel5]|uniref:hemerythrin domain-containing protein n=1 Tax=Cellulosispirillum alkaliphilum TaxID=3039283 RepID=UPI002A5295B5|nr:hemerythrin domain-containing protein [Chitinispirillales bacterium ANBcel5]
MQSSGLLSDEHSRLRVILSQMEEHAISTVRIREKLFERFYNLLSSHMKFEEVVLRGLLDQNVDCSDEIHQLIEEHYLFRLMLFEMKAVPKNHKRWGAKVRIVKDFIDRHIDYEEIDFYEALREALSEEQFKIVWKNFSQSRDEMGFNLTT